MTAKLIDGRRIAEKIIKDIRKDVRKLKSKPGLAVVLIGDDPASQIYVGNKEKACRLAGFYSQKHLLEENIGLGDVLTLINSLNNDPKVHGILIQLPIPRNMDGRLVLDSIMPDKDVDGFHPINMGNLIAGFDTIIPCTAQGIMHLIDSTGIDIEGKRAVVIGRSNIVGKPTAVLLMQRNATVTICHSRTRELASICKEADILVSAVGRPSLVTGDMVKGGAVVIDVGMNRLDGKLKGDVDFDSARKVAGWITPVPGGVGPMTIACLLKNTLCCMRRAKI